MEFPEADRVIYERNPLKEVVCQLRFPRILAIQERIPASFQAALGSAYPFVETRESIQLSLGAEQEAGMLRQTNYDFLTEDKAYRVSLCSDYLALSATRYERWELFLDHMTTALQALLSVYPVPLFTRIGLRYVDEIDKAMLGLGDEPWSSLIVPSALGLMAEGAVPISDVLELGAATVLQLGDNGKVVIRTTLKNADADTKKKLFVIDSDFFYDETVKGADDAIAICSRFNKSAGRAFRWLISPRLHEALGPSKPGDNPAVG